jgi:hypothetical protein
MRKEHAMADWGEWGRIIPDLVVGGAGGSAGALARELGSNRRVFSWVLILDILCAAPLGMAAVTGASAFGIDEPRSQVTVAIIAGLVGKAMIIETVRSMIRIKFPPSP